jgi:hypothetical protein
MLPATTVRKVQVLATALALGAALVALTPGEAAHAAKKRWYLPEKSEPEVSVETAARDSINNLAKCTITRPDGTVDFYLPMDSYYRFGTWFICGTDGQWFAAFSPPRATPGVEAPSTGVRTPAR